MVAPVLVVAKSPHDFKSSVEMQARTNKNISLAPSSNSSYGFASLSEFDEDDEKGSEEEEEDFGDIVDIEGSDFDELELAESDNPDEDGDGVDDLLDDDQDTGEGDDGEVIGGAPKKKSSSVERYTGKFGFAHKYQISDRANYVTNFKASMDNQPGRSKQDKLNYAFSTGPEFKLGDTVKLKTAVSYIHLQQDNQKFLSTFVGSVGLGWDLSKRIGLGVNYNYQDKDVTERNSPDAIINTLTFSADWALTKNDILKLKYSPTVEDSSITTRNKDDSGFEITYSRKLPWNAVRGIGFKRDEVDYEKLPTPRSDRIDGYAVQLETEFTDNFSASLAYEERELDSNIDSKDGKNNSVLLGLQYKF